MAKKPEIRKHITNAKLALKTVMQENLSLMGASYVSLVMTRFRKLPDSQRYSALGGDIKPAGALKYKQDLLAAMAVIAFDALAQARKEIPKAKDVKLMEDEESLKLGEFERLPPDVQGRLTRQAQTILDKQTSDLVGAVNFQFQHSVDSTDSEATLENDLSDSVDEFIDGAAVEAGAGTMASQVVNESRQAFFFADDTLAEVDAFQFTNGDPVSPICTDLAGTIFPKDDPDSWRYQPPLHFNCKSYIVPILLGNLDEALKRAGQDSVETLAPSKKSLEDSIQFGEHFCCGTTL